MLAELRVPVYRVEVEVRLGAAPEQVRQVTLFLPPDHSMERLFESSEAFLPVEEKGAMRWIARAAIATITMAGLPVGEDDDGLPRDRRSIVAELVGGARVEGELRWVRTAQGGRTTDLLNQPGASFALHQAERVVWVAKRHVSSVEEVRTEKKEAAA